MSVGARNLADVTRLDPPGDLATPSTWSLGLAYAREGRVNVLHHDRVRHEITARCRGSHNRNYTVHTSYACGPDGELESIDGSCSCPVVYNCKHCVAVVATELNLAAPGTGRPTPGRSGSRTRALLSELPAIDSEMAPEDLLPPPAAIIQLPPWRRTLDRIFTPVHDPGRPDLQPLALLLTFEPDPVPGDQSGVPSRYASTAFGRRLTELGYAFPTRPGFVHVVPARAGKRQAWVRTGISWMRLRSSEVQGANPAHLDALNALRRLYADVGPYLGAQDPIALEKITHPALWSVLKEIVDAGVTLVEDGSLRPVSIEPDPAKADIEITQTDAGELTVRAAVRHPRLDAGTATTRLGDPPHGVAWRDDSGVHLARFDQPADRTWKQLAAERDEISIPADDQEDFVQTVLPRIAQVGWTSPDGSFEPPAPPAPRLHLEIGIAQTSAEAPTPQAHLRWGWHYRDEDGRGRGPLPLETTSRDATRDLDQERSIATAVAAEFADLPTALREPSETAPQAPLLRQDAQLSGMDVVRLIQEVIPRLEELGVIVETGQIPAFQETSGARIQVGLDHEGSGNDWLDLEISVEIDGHELPIAALIRSLTLGDEAVFLPDGSYLRLDDPELDQLRQLLEEAAELGDQRRTGVRVPRVRMSWWEDLLSLNIVQASTDAWFDALRKAMTSPPPVAELPAGLEAQLRPYQLAGYRWLAGLRRSGLGGVLADDMGLGKTVQALAMILDEREHPDPAGAGRRPAPWLVVAPTSVVPNWASEAKRFTPSLRVAMIEATQARRGVPLRELAGQADVVITSYALLRLEADEYAAQQWAGMLLDEAQNAKNHSSKVFAAVMGVGAPMTFAITGTPMENNLGELWAMFSLTAPGLLGSPKQFREAFRRPIERQDDVDGQRMALLRRRIAPFLLRRTKNQVALDLPPKQEQVVQIDLAPAHRRIYDRQLQRERQRVLQLTDDMDHNQIEVLAALTRLRQLAIDPSLVDQGETEIKAPSSKLDALVPLLQEAANEGHRVLVFSQFTRYLRKIAARLDHEKIGYSYLDGTTAHRRDVIDGFTQGDDPVFLISLKAGGAGINLTEADYAILADPWWNPAVENQAVDRTHRIGQTRPVHVYRMVSRGTIEEKVLALQDAKRELISGVLGADTDEAAGEVLTPGRGGRLSAEDVRMLLG